jgi:predicted MFS family arabinose efflux permease
VALAWLVYRTSHSAVLLGLMGLAGGLPAALMTPFAGVLADRGDPRRLLLSAQALAALLALLLAVLVLLGRLHGAGILALVCVQGIVSGVDRPVRQMFMARLVARREDLGSALATSSMVYDAARLLGPALGGLVLARFREGPAFGLNALAQALGLALLLAIRPPPRPAPAAPGAGVAAALAQGLRYAGGSPPVRSILLLSAGISFAGIGYLVLMPVMATDVLRGGPHTLGLLLSAVGAGAMAGGVLLGLRPGLAGRPRLVSGGAGLFGLALLVFSLSRWLGLSVLALGAAGLGIMAMMTGSGTILLTRADPDQHGRVMSLFTLSYLGAAPLGSLGAGLLGRRIGAPATIAASAVLCLAAAAWFASRFRPGLRQAADLAHRQTR